jgi:hypothetical protein
MLRHVVLAALAAGLFLAGPALRANLGGEAAPRLGAQQRDVADKGGTSTATGFVSEVSCSSGLKIQLDAPDGARTLRRKTGTPFQITAPTREQENINPCTSLKGLRVSVEFVPDNEKGLTGTMERVQILPAEGSGNAVLPSGQPHKSAPWKGPLMVTTTSEGLVKEVRCDGKELRITFAVRDVEFKLHARDYTRLEIEEEVAYQTKNYDPCAKLNGHSAIVTYVLVEKKPYDGEIQAIEVAP